MQRMRLRTVAGALLGLSLLVAACGDDNADVSSAPDVEDDAPPAAGACLAGDEDCQDIGAGPPADQGDDDGTNEEPSEQPVTPVTDETQSTDHNDGGDEDRSDDASTRERARAMLGVTEDELPDDVRIARRGEESYMVTEDYRIGRLTVDLDPGDDGVYRVVKVVAELPDGPETFTPENPDGSAGGGA